MNPASKVSSHLLIGQKGQSAEIAPESDVAWANGVCFWRGITDMNGTAYSIEIENRTGQKGYVGTQGYSEPLLARAAVAVLVCAGVTTSRWAETISSHTPK